MADKTRPIPEIRIGPGGHPQQIQLSRSFCELPLRSEEPDLSFELLGGSFSGERRHSRSRTRSHSFLNVNDSSQSRDRRSPSPNLLSPESRSRSSSRRRLSSPNLARSEKSSRSPSFSKKSAKDLSQGKKSKMNNLSQDSDDKDVDRSNSSITDNTLQPMWDISRVVPKEPISASESFRGFLKVLRVFMYIFLLAIVWIFSTASLGTVLMLEAALSKEKDQQGNDYKHVARNQLIWIICVPHLCVFVLTVFKSMFGNHSWPSLKLFIGTFFLIEIPHTFGLTLLIFQVLPNFGTFYSLGLMNSACWIPAIFRVFFKVIQGTSVVKKILWKTVDVLVMVIVTGAVTLPVLVLYFELGNFWWSSHSHAVSKFPSYQSSNLWQVPVALILVSVKWWENFIGKNTCNLKLWDLKKAIRMNRNNLNVLFSLLNILVVIGGVYLWEWTDGSSDLANILNPVIKINENNTEFCHENKSAIINYVNQTVGNETELLKQISYNSNKYCDITVLQYLTSYTPAIVCICSSLIVYYCCGLASKLLMQRVSFVLPVMMATPTISTIIVLQCKDIIPEIPVMAGLQFEFRCDLAFQNSDLYVISGIIAWLCLLLLTRHTWSPNIERLSHIERIFVTPMFTGPLLCQCLVMNRRDDNMDKSFIGVKKNPELDQLYNQINGVKLNIKTEEEKEKEGNLKGSHKAVPMIYACATMWHETSKEMVQLLKSIYRMDADQAARRLAAKYLSVVDPDYYEFEAHVMFDDAMELDDDDKWVPNSFVIKMKESMREAASAVTRVDENVPPPTRISTPYGGRLVWKLPGGNNMVVHLKDKNKIRHRKRWSQVMYMYYLLGYKLFDEVPDDVAIERKLQKNESTTSTNATANNQRMSTWADQIHASAGQNEHFMKSDIFKNMEDSLVQKSENTFILALDGDVDFKPDAVTMLLDRMRVNPKTGAACGRIHPIGSSPIVWYQKFEYAIGHWFQKSTEHVLGCVLCSPGCFSLFRASALLDDNVMKRYTTEPTEPVHYLQYDQGEDRWLCTLLLQQGYRVDYTAASDALTYAPETFDEFFKQRRRWTPSTMANIIDLIGDSKNTVLANPNISYLYMIYQFVLMIATVLGPATIVMAIAAALLSVFDLTLLESYAISLAPVVVYIAVCMWMKEKYQLIIGAFLSVVYSAIMMVVLVGIIQTIVVDSILNPSLLFLVAVSACFVFAGLIHPYEFTLLIYGILYFLCIPAGYLVLMIYSICNLHVVSWGTREVPKRKSKAQRAAEAESALKEKEKKKKKGLFSFLRLDVFIDSLKDMLTQIFNKSNKDSTEAKFQKATLKTTRSMQKDLRKLVQIMRNPNQTVIDVESESDQEDEKTEMPLEQSKNEENKPDTQVDTEIVDASLELDDKDNPNWIKDKRLGAGLRKELSEPESQFWTDMIEKYLTPLKKNPKEEKRMAEEMISLRNNASFGYWFINFLWILFNFMIQRNSYLNVVNIGGLKTQPLGLVFLVFFLIVLTLQMIGMIIHRWSTFLQLISITEIRRPWRKQADSLQVQEAYKITKALLENGELLDEHDEEDIYSDIANTGDNKMNNQHEKINFNLKVVKKQLEERKRQHLPIRNKDDHVVDIPPEDYDDIAEERNVGTLRHGYPYKRQRYRENIRRNLERQISRHTRYNPHHESHDINHRRDSHAARDYQQNPTRVAYPYRRNEHESVMEVRLRNRLNHLMHHKQYY